MGIFHKPQPDEPEPPRENEVLAQPATVETCAADYAHRVGLPQPHQSATRHTWGRNR